MDTEPIPPLAGTPPATPPPETTAEPLAAGADAGNGGGNPSAADLAIEHDGLKGGRGRADGLTPGSDDAKKADRLYDNIRKWQDRNPGQIHPQEKSLCQSKQDYFSARRKPLPAGQSQCDISAAVKKISEREPDALPAAGIPPVGEVQSPADLIPAAERALIAWAGTDIEPLLVELLALLEEWRDWEREKVLMAANLPMELVREIREESKWSDRTKKIICESGSRVLAKLGNKAGISAEYKDEVFLGVGMILIAGQEFRFSKRIQKLKIAAHGETLKK